MEIFEDPDGVALDAKFAKARPRLDHEDAGGLAAIRTVATAKSYRFRDSVHHPAISRQRHDLGDAGLQAVNKSDSL